jgi:agmatine/peptidylarginine deiminase
MLLGFDSDHDLYFEEAWFAALLSLSSASTFWSVFLSRLYPNPKIRAEAAKKKIGKRMVSQMIAVTTFTDAKDRKLEILKIRQPDPILITADEAAGVVLVEGTLPRKTCDRMAASYINFYTCNRGIILPTFNDPHDRLVMDLLQKAMPDRKIVGVYAREILLGGGNIHCITQQQPRE